MSDTTPGPTLHNPDLAPEVGRLGPNEGAIGPLAEHWPRVDDGLQIRGGGAVAVDTATLSAAAVRFDAAREELAAMGERLAGVRAELRALSEHTADARAAASVLALKLDAVQAEADEIAAALREAAYAYEMVEIEAEHRAAVLAGDAARAQRLDARMTALVDAHPDAWRLAVGAQFERAVMWPSELVRQATHWGVAVGGEVSDPASIVVGAAAGLLTLGGAAVVGLAGAGRLARDARLSGTAGPVTVTPVAPASTVVGAAGAAVGAGTPPSRSPAAVAPRSLAAVTERMPGGGDSRVRVERYTMPDGSRQYAVYLAGMQSFDVGGDEAWDNASNVELYAGKASDSYAATELALAQAGVRAGDAVHVFGFSQGAMIGAHLALEGGYDARTLVSIGSPVDADVGPDTLAVTVRHTDDPVAGLAGGGHSAAVGAPGSFVAERVFHPDVGWDEPRLPAHRLTAYAETAALVDDSTDPRVDALRGVFADLARADSVEVSEYAVRRGER
ncbi:hypothetical protein [Microbacterium sp. NPDC056569]|uniref:hypothetical protein n=1 Tax=Microbacterium sp. NPDC056569 TaxID=3345867 RepID=UPI0036725C71